MDLQFISIELKKNCGNEKKVVQKLEIFTGDSV